MGGEETVLGDDAGIQRQLGDAMGDDVQIGRVLSDLANS